MFGFNDNQQNASGAQFTPPPNNNGTTTAGDNNAVGQEISPPATPPPPSTLPGSFTPPKPLQDVTAAPSGDDAAASAPEAPSSPPSPLEDKPFSPFDPTNSPDNDSSSDNPGALAASPNDLVRIKQDALQKLSPLVDHLDQTPEERFRTTMMLIQATDDSSKIKDAYNIAQQITDEKVKAQALLDIVNEINYFTQQQKETEEK